LTTQAQSTTLKHSFDCLSVEGCQCGKRYRPMSIPFGYVLLCGGGVAIVALLAVVCRTNKISGKAADLLRAEGFGNVFLVDDGMVGWSGKGFTTE